MELSQFFPVWGPYGKKYTGISRTADHSFAKGVRFDFTTVPAIFGGDIKVPNVTLPSGCHPWHCSDDYSLITYRHDLDGRDIVYAEVSYVRLTDESTLVRTEFTNNSRLIQNCLINYFSSIEYPEASYCRVSYPEKSEVINALDYTEYIYATKRPWDEQNADGFKKGEFADKRFVGGFGLGDRANKWHMPHRYIAPFGAEKGDKVSYKLACRNGYRHAVLAVRYRTSDIKYTPRKMVGVELINSEKTAIFTVSGFGEQKTLRLSPADEPELALVDLGKLDSGEYRITLTSEGMGAAELDFLCVCEKEDADNIKTENIDYDYVPQISEARLENGFVSACKYKDVDGIFTLRTFNRNTRFRRIETGSLEDCMTARLSNSDPSFDDVTESFTSAFERKHSDNGFFHNAIVHTLFVEPDSTHIEYAVISKGETEYLSAEEYEKLYHKKLAAALPVPLNKDGRKYELSCEILKSTAMVNAVYPIYKHGEYIIHHTPGKRWDCLYTWDSGFIGLGMTDYAPKYAKYSLETYLSSEDNPDYAFLHHGSPVPVQMYLYLEMLKRENNKTYLLSLYPRLKLYYDFLAGKIRGSTTAKLKSGLTTTYDYFYSSSGMDDYPAQVAMMDRNIRDTSAPVISSSQVIRCAKILRMVASKLGKTEDVEEYSADVDRIANALAKYSWDEESGYYGYVLHDENYEPTGEIMRAENGENLNKGLDGIYPLIAGVCGEEQKKAILSHLKSEKEMLSPFGISAVDMSASYFMVNGYWNGNVWFPHQWFIWKTMLDIGETDFAFTIASRALDIWKREVDYSYYTFEMVNVVTGRGGWFHNFGGLSTPITMWANAYFKAGTFNSGFDVWTDNISFGSDNKSMTAEFTCFGANEKTSFVVALNDDENTRFKAYLDGEEIAFNERFKGTLEISVSINDNKKHVLRIAAAEHRLVNGE